MKQTQSPDTFLEHLSEVNQNAYQIVTACRDLVKRVFPDLKERVMYGGIMFSLHDTDFGGVFPYAQHVSFEFSNGYLLKDQNNLLEGNGKYRRHLKLRSVADIQEKHLEYFIRQ